MVNSFNDSRINPQITLVNDSAYMQTYALVIGKVKNFATAKGYVCMEQCSIIYLSPNDTFDDKLGTCTHYSLVPVVIPKGCLPPS